MIDWSRVSELRNEIGEEDFSDVVTIFLDEVDEEVATLADCPDAALTDKLHFLKGSALNLGFSGFAALCLAGEQAIKAGDRVDRRAVLDGYAEARQHFIDGLARNDTA